MLRKEFKLLAVILAAGLMVSACDSGDDNDQGTAPPSGNPSTPPASSGSNNPSVIGLSDERDLIQFKIGSTTNATSVKLTGMVVDNASSPPVPQAMDFSPANGKLYIYFNDGRFYTANTGTGALTLVGKTNFPSPGFIDSIDFNPVPNLIRAISDQSERAHYRVSPTDASLVASDTAIAYVTGDANSGKVPSIEGLAYTGASGATTTTAYVIDTNQDVLARLGGVNGDPSPNGGQLTTIGALGTAIGGGGAVGFDIPTGQTTTGYLSDSSTGAQSNNTDIYSVNLSTGALTKLMTVNAKRLVGIAIVPGSGTGGSAGGGTTAPPPPTKLGLATGLDSCKTALAGTGFTSTAGTPDEVCFMCAFTPADGATLVDADLSNVTKFVGTGLLLGLNSVSVKTANSANDIVPAAEGQFIGGLFRLPGGSPGELSVLPDVEVETFDDGTATGESALFNFLLSDSGLLLLADAGGMTLPISDITNQPFFAGFKATKKFDEVRFTYSVGVVGLQATIDTFYACTEGTSAGGFPTGLGLP